MQQGVGLEEVFQPLYLRLGAAERLNLFRCNRHLAHLVLQYSTRTRLDLDCPKWPLIRWAHHASNMTAMRLASHAPNVTLTMTNGLVTPPKQLLPHITALGIGRTQVTHSNLRALKSHSMPRLQHVALWSCRFPYGSVELILMFYLSIFIVGLGCTLIEKSYGLQACLVYLGFCVSVIMGIVDPFRINGCYYRFWPGGVWAVVYGFLCTAACYFSLFFMFSYCTNRAVWACCTPVVVAVWGLALAIETYWPRASIFPVPTLEWIDVFSMIEEERSPLADVAFVLDVGKLVHLTTDDERVCDHLPQLPALQTLHLTCASVSKGALQRLRSHPALTDVRLGSGRKERVIVPALADKV